MFFASLRRKRGQDRVGAGARDPRPGCSARNAANWTQSLATWTRATSPMKDFTTPAMAEEESSLEEGSHKRTLQDHGLVNFGHRRFRPFLQRRRCLGDRIPIHRLPDLKQETNDLLFRQQFLISPGSSIRFRLADISLESSSLRLSHDSISISLHRNHPRH